MNKYTLKNANVISMVNDMIQNNMDVVIKDGYIVEVQNTTDEFNEYDIDCTGKYIIPALWDMHYHIFYADYLEYALSYGVTTVLNLHGYKEILKWRKQMEAGKRIGADIYTTGTIIDSMPDGLGLGFKEVYTREEARRAVIKCQEDGYDFIKIYNNLTPECYDEIAKTAKEIGIRVFGHLPNCINAHYTKENIDYEIKQETIEHLLFLNDNNVESAARQGVWLDPTFIVEKSFRGIISDEAKEEFKYMRKGIRNFVWNRGKQIHKTPQKK